MKRNALFAAMLAALGATTAIASTGAAARPMTLGEAVSYIQSLYPGEVVLAEMDATGDKPAHVHVDIRFAHGRTAKLELDARTRQITSRMAGVEVARGDLSLAQAVALVSERVPGTVTFAELDTTNAAGAHYHVDVRTPQGKVVRLNVEASTGRFVTRNPAAPE